MNPHQNSQSALVGDWSWFNHHKSGLDSADTHSNWIGSSGTTVPFNIILSLPIFYPVRIETLANEFTSDRERFYLYPGMLLDCVIVIGQRSLLTNLLAPLLQVKNEAFQENVFRLGPMMDWGSHFLSIFDPRAW